MNKMAASRLYRNRQIVPPTAPMDPQIRNVSSADQQSKRCRDFVWGICTKGAQCKFRDELDVESMKDILKFCHDYQNRTEYTKADCTYLQMTREEEILFLTTGQIPRALAERYAAMSSAPMNLYGNEYTVQALPPHLPPPTSAVPAPPLPTPLPPLLAPPPPPPPTTSTTPVRMTPPIFSALPPFNTATFPVTHPPPSLPPMFDTSRPPPPLPTNATVSKNGATKRLAEPYEAGPSKARKAESNKVIDSLCENCIQRELRIELYRQELQKLECEREYQSFIFEKKSEEYDNSRLLLKSVISPELFHILDDYIEGSSEQVQVHDLLVRSNQTSSFDSGTSTVPRQFLLQLMECVFSNQRSLVETEPVTSVGVNDSSLLHSLTAFARRANPISHTSADIIQAMFEVIRNSTKLTNGRNQVNGSPTKEMQNVDQSISSTSNISNSSTNGFSHFVNEYKVDSEASSTVASSSRYPITTNVAVRTYPSGTASTTALTSGTSLPPTTSHLPNVPHLPNAFHPSGVPAAPPATHPPAAPFPQNAPHPPTVKAPSAYMSYQSVVPPPPSRGYYPQPY